MNSLQRMYSDKHLFKNNLVEVEILKKQRYYYMKDTDRQLAHRDVILRLNFFELFP